MSHYCLWCNSWRGCGHHLNRESLFPHHRLFPHKDNLSKHDRRALKELQTKNDIIIIKADKVGAICIMIFEQKESNLYGLLKI